ncbi:MAG: aminoacyl-tRNA hydrolase [Proteobacteria bacterium]|nr:aminoacyl-tRNA hydrolase [Pseudomonadota bacterium]
MCLLIVGLGNPGSRYENTRHNAGFWLIDQIADTEQFRTETKFHGQVCKVKFPSTDCWLLKPNTFMNNSGQAVIALANYYKITVEQILIVHDELDFPAGTIRLKKGGGDGKHNGLKSIISHLGDNNFLRLRIGIGHPGRGGNVTNYVLNSPTKDEQIEIAAKMDTVLQVIPYIVEGNLEKAMQQLHS